MQNNDHEYHGNFSLGFIVGVLAGVSELFLTKTNEGKELKDKIVKEWKNIRKKLEEDGVISGNESHFTDIISSVRSKIFEILGEEIPKKKKKKINKSRRNKMKTKTTKQSVSKKKIFKGI